jgi:hypothetical protein
MNNFWMTFEDGTAASCQGYDDYDAKKIAEKLSGKKVKECKPLPYPADPSIWKFDHPLHGKTPSFCFRPKECKGRTACPQAYSCTE